MQIALPDLLTVNLSIESYVHGSDQFNMPVLYVYARRKRNFVEIFELGLEMLR
jgi:hypothetical protein